MAQTVKLIKVFKSADYAVMERRNGEYVAGWCPRIKLSEEECRDPEKYDEGLKLNMYWEQGHYFSTKRSALHYAVAKEMEATRAEIENLRRYIQDIQIDEDEDNKLLMEAIFGE